MADLLNPPPRQDRDINSHSWQEWFFRLWKRVLEMTTVTIESVTGAAADVTRYGQLIVGEYHDSILVKFEYSNSTYDVTAAVTGTGATSNANAMATVSTGSGTGTASLTSVRCVEYRPAHEVHSFFTVLFASANRDANTYQRIGIYDATEGLWIGYSGTSFGIAYRTGTADTFVAQSSFNKDRVDGTGLSRFTLDQTKLNQYRIDYGWLGSSPIMFQVYGGDSLGWITMHVIDPSNSETAPILKSPSNPIKIEVGRTSGSGAVTMSTGSWNAGTTEGRHSHAGHRVFAAKIEKTIAAANTYIATFQNKSIYQSKTNKVRIEATFLGVATDGTKNCTFDFYQNSTLTGTSYTDVSTANSVTAYDTAGAVSANGNFQLSIPMAKADGKLLDLGSGHIHLELMPGETMTILGSTTASNDVTISFRWEEYFA